jgi:hypothetical protein
MLFPELIDLAEETSFVFELLSDIISAENVFKIHPTALENEPFLDNNINVFKLELPFFDFIADFSNKFRPHHGSDFHLIVFQKHD